MTNKCTFSFSEMQKKADIALSGTYSALEERRGDLYPQTDGQTRLSLIANIVFTGVWAGIYALVIWLIWYYGRVHYGMIITGIVLFSILILFMLIDEVLKISFYGKILEKIGLIDSLKSQVRNIQTNTPNMTDHYVESIKKNQDESIKLGICVDENLRKIEGMSNHKKTGLGVIAGFKNFLFFSAGIFMTFLGSLAFFDVLDQFVENVFEASSFEGFHVFYYIVMAIICVGVILISKIMWGTTDCQVNNLTLLPTLAGPIAFLVVAFVLLGTAILVYHLVLLILALVAAAVGIGCVLSSLCGG